MELKLNIETSRVKCLSFHEQRPWLLASFHTGEVVIYDFEVGVSLQTYKESDHPIRACAFHPRESLFATGSDDCSVKVYDYEKQRLVATFLDHLDYIRTVQFHSEKPFLISASDDQIIRIYNYKTKTCLTTINGHNHYVMSAFFHPQLPLVISASLDDSVRVWNVQSLFNTGQPSGGFFTLADATQKFQMDEHQKGVNYAEFSVNMPYAVSCSDDELVKLWRLSDSEMSIVATLRGHVGNVNCAIFHPKADVVISCSEDSTVRVWDARRFIHLTKFKSTEGNRYWTLAAHSHLPIFAAGSDNGLQVFRLFKAHIAHDVFGRYLIYYFDHAIHRMDMEKVYDETTSVTNPRALGSRCSPLDPPPRHVYYNDAQNMALVQYTNVVEVHTLTKGNQNQIVEQGVWPAWVSRNMYCFVTKEGVLHLRELGAASARPTSQTGVKRVFASTTGCVYLVRDGTVTCYDVFRGQVVGELKGYNVTRAYMAPDKKHVAFFTRDAVLMATPDLTVVHKACQESRPHSGVWYMDGGCFVYSNVTHIKYILPFGEGGTMRSFHQRMYLAYVGEKTKVFTSDYQFFSLELDFTEARFRTALRENKMDVANKIINSAKLCSDTILDYIRDKGHPEIAVHFANDPLKKFKYAVESGDIETAQRCAEELNKPELWERLADKAMEEGRFAIAENALARGGLTERLALLYIVSGQAKKLAAMQLDEPMRLQRAIWTNDRFTEAQLLKDAAPVLAALAARDVDGAPDIRLHDEAAANVAKEPRPELRPVAIPDLELADWPALVVSKPVFIAEPEKKDNDNENDNEDGWASSGDENENEKDNENAKDDEDGEGDGWEPMEDIEIPDEDEVEGGNDKPLAIAPGQPIEDAWRNNSESAAVLAAAGDFGGALSFLRAQIALLDPTPLRDLFAEAFVAAHACVPTLAGAPPLVVPISETCGGRSAGLPAFSFGRAQSLIAQGHSATQAGKFAHVRDVMTEALHILCLVPAASDEDKKLKANMIETCRHYITGMALELARKETNDSDRQLELAAYFTQVRLEPGHRRLTLQSAMRVASKAGRYKLAEGFAKRLLEMAPSAKIAEAATKIVKVAASKGPDSGQINYDARNPFDICCADFVPIYRGTAKVVCPYCGACYQKSHRGELCTICGLSEIGGDATGLV